MTNLTRKQTELIAMALKHAKQGIIQPEFAKDHCREIVELLQQIEEPKMPRTIYNELAR